MFVKAPKVKKELKKAGAFEEEGACGMQKDKVVDDDNAREGGTAEKTVIELD